MLGGRPAIRRGLCRITDPLPLSRHRGLPYFLEQVFGHMLTLRVSLPWNGSTGLNEAHPRPCPTHDEKIPVDTTRLEQAEAKGEAASAEAPPPTPRSLSQTISCYGKLWNLHHDVRWRQKPSFPLLGQRTRVSHGPNESTAILSRGSTDNNPH